VTAQAGLAEPRIRGAPGRHTRAPSGRGIRRSWHGGVACGWVAVLARPDQDAPRFDRLSRPRESPPVSSSAARSVARGSLGLVDLERHDD